MAGNVEDGGAQLGRGPSPPSGSLQSTGRRRGGVAGRGGEGHAVYGGAGTLLHWSLLAGVEEGGGGFS